MFVDGSAKVPRKFHFDELAIVDEEHGFWVPNGIRYLWRRASARNRTEAPRGIAFRYVSVSACFERVRL